MSSDSSKVLWILTGVSIALLIYEAWTLGAQVLLPLLGNANVLQTDFHYYYDAAIRFRGDPSRLYLATDDVIAGLRDLFGTTGADPLTEPDALAFLLPHLGARVVGARERGPGLPLDLIVTDLDLLLGLGHRR